MPGCASIDHAGEDHYAFGVLFVGGFRAQRPGSAIAALAAALYGWLYRWNATLEQKPKCPRSAMAVLARALYGWLRRGGKSLDQEPESAAAQELKSLPILSEVVLSPTYGENDQPARLTLSACLHMADDDRHARWLLAESSWADVFTTPRFLGMARWIWKVSTCMLVMEFFVPMRRHWREKRRLIAAVYLLLMGSAAMLSVLFSVLLLALALAAYLPIPRIDKAVRWVVVSISAILGDTYMLAHCPVQFAAMRSRVARDLAWLQEHCDKVAIIAHSQGSAVAHRVLKQGSYRRDGSLKALVTLGQSITKLDLLERMDWELCERTAARQSRWLVTLGMACAGLPAFSFVVSRWVSAPLLKAPGSFPTSLLLIAVGFASIASGVALVMLTFRGDPRERLGLPDAEFTWSDYYASADPVANGPLDDPAGEQRDDPPAGNKILLTPGACNQVYNSGSVLFDHNGYLRNQNELLTRLLNDLVSAAYSEDVKPTFVPEIADCADKARDQRQWLVHWLVAIRVLTIGVLAAAWWADTGRALKRPLTQLMHLFTVHARMGNGPARLLTALLAAAVFYLIAVTIWRLAMERSVQNFFDHADRPKANKQQDPAATSEQPAVNDIPSGMTESRMTPVP